MDFDVVVLGGALSGAATALLLLQERPDLRILIVEKSTQFKRRIGEATVEVSTYFLQRCLGLTQHLHHEHLVKNGFRLWFANEHTQRLPDCSELGGRYLSRLPAYLIDRALLDQTVLDRAVALGVKLWRPAKVKSVKLNPGLAQSIHVDMENESRHVRARWVVDATGVACFLARQEGWWKRLEDHPTATAWARWTDVVDFDSPELARKYPDWSRRVFGMRGTATNHLMGQGWWAWWIPLRGGDVSIGTVLDQRLVRFPDGANLEQRLKSMLVTHPVGRELLADAKCLPGDVHWRKDLAYSSTRLAGDGFVLVGDAAGFLDPFYSPGLDWLSYTTWSASRLVLAQHQGESAEPLAADFNSRFVRSYSRWFHAIYRNKYEYMGEFDLMRLAFRLDIVLYYLGVASQPYLRGPNALMEPYYSTPISTPFYGFMRAYNQRLSRIARHRRRTGRLGRRNAHEQYLVPGFALDRSTAFGLLPTLARLLWLELNEGWKSWMANHSEPNHVPSKEN